MAYESPIEIIQREATDWFETNVIKACVSVGINVNRDRLIRALQFDRNQYNAGYADGYNASRWIPVKNRLPEEGELVLICFESAKDTPHWRIQVGYLGNHDMEDNNFQKIGLAQVWYTDKCYWSFDKVVAWQPLPEPYKEA